MLDQQQLAALLIKVAVSASIASILMRFASIQKILLRDERTVSDRLQLAFVFSVLFGGSAGVRILSHHQYSAIDLALEGAVIAGMLGGYVSGLITGICVSLPDMFDGKFMSMPLFAAAGLLGALMHDLAPEKEDIWYFSPFVDLNLYRLFRQILRWNRNAIQRGVVERAAFNVACNAIAVIAESLRWGIHSLFPDEHGHGTFFLFQGTQPLNWWLFAASAVTTLFAVSLPVRIWSSFRAEKQLESQRVRLTEARLAALTNQINPHFLFNTLNSVSTLIRIDPNRARGMIYKLSNILRRLLRKAENFSLLRDEISFIDDYLAIEMVRFGDKLRFHKEISEDTLDRLVPSMILQPIIENSIKHGLANKIDGGEVRLRTWLEGTRLHISVEDDGVGIDESKLATLFEQGIGVSNVNERLRVLFGPGYRMLIESKPGQGTRTSIEIPELENHVPEAAAETLVPR
ncbi:MAG: histidine kinase [Acidobacteriaceae bacterium]|nr:histidine kinase [Acidobacteriaceae bacterium]MBV9766315.1 histidine kinase [Acidobacteriaceae bacterium]